MAPPETADPRVISKRTTNALDRLDRLEQSFAQLVSTINNSLGGVSRQLDAHEEVFEAVITLLGREAVQGVVKDLREKKAVESMEAEKKALNELLDAKVVQTAATVTEESIIVGKETNPDGTVRIPGRVQLAFQRIDVNFQSALKGVAVGFILDLPNGGKFEVQEIYVPVPQDPNAVNLSPSLGDLSGPAPVPAPTEG